jgi:monoamine oxidase
VDIDIAIVGAGAAGLTALRVLDRAGCKVLCLEARDRIGGRILTLHDPLSPIPIELGAEFLHGRAPELWQFVESGSLAAYDIAERAVHIQGGKVQHHADSWELVGRVTKDMERAAETGPDRTFQVFLDGTSYPVEVKRLATSYVEGFNAARKEIVGIASLTKDAKAADEIGGDQSLRWRDGYDALLRQILTGTVRLNSVVEHISWRPGSAEIRFRSAVTGHVQTIRCRRVILTVPLGVLQSGDLEFDPAPSEALDAARSLAFGHVFRVILRFREPFWEHNSELSDAGFLLADEAHFPAWWTPLPIHAPLITGWSAGPHTDALIGQSRETVIRYALDDLARITNTKDLNELLEAAYFHDWAADPFTRGAYSYVPAGAMQAREKLAEPVDNTLYFSGEATELNGHSATVHGAMASGIRVARQVLDNS